MVIYVLLGSKAMKKLYLLPLLTLTLFACGKEEAPALPPLDPGTSYYTSKLTADLSTMGTDKAGSATDVDVLVKSNEDETVSYEFTIGANSYKKQGTDVFEIIVQGSSYIKSKSTYKVSRLILDYFGMKGTNFTVYGGEEVKEAHSSTIQPIDSNDPGAVVNEFEINSTSWSIVNDGSTNKKTSIYSITVIYEI